MTPEIKLLRRLAAEIRREVVDLDTLIEESQHLRREPAYPSDPFLLRAAASILHDFYSGLERTFVRIARDLDGGAPAGGGWHQELPQQMTLEVPRSRPPALDADARDAVEFTAGTR